jgi:murein DD-endopeptidase MepM/ murein hydrolase activator NlpD
VVDVPDAEFAASARASRRREPRAPKKGRLGRKSRKAEAAVSAPDIEPEASAFDLMAAFGTPDVDDSPAAIGPAMASAAIAPAVAPAPPAPALAPVASAADVPLAASARRIAPAATAPEIVPAAAAPDIAPAAAQPEVAPAAARPEVAPGAFSFDLSAAFDAPGDPHDVVPTPFRPAARPARASTGAARSSASRPPARRSSLRKSIVSRSVSLVAMGFAAMLAIATSVPSLSLLTPEDVQAMALNSTTTTVDGQRVDITGGASAAGVGRENYQAQTIEEYAAAAGIRAEATFTNNPLGTIQWPFAVGVHIGDRFGYRDCYGCSSDHHGQDFNPGLGAEIQAIADGVVSESTDEGGSLGVVMMIDHVIDGEVITSVYAHMEYGSRRFEVGDTVHVADVVGTTGDTGMSTGPHLHFEIRVGGKDGYWIDPLVWLYENTN